MESIYVENYVKIPFSEKVDFLESVSNSDEFEISNQEVIFCEESVIFDFNKNSDVNLAYNKFQDFFKTYKEIKVDKITKMRDKTSQMILKFDDSKNHIRI